MNPDMHKPLQSCLDDNENLPTLPHLSLQLSMRKHNPDLPVDALADLICLYQKIDLNAKMGEISKQISLMPGVFWGCTNQHHHVLTPRS